MVARAYLFAMGATLVVVTVGFNQTAQQDEIALLAIAMAAYLAALVLRLGYRWLRPGRTSCSSSSAPVSSLWGSSARATRASPYAAFYIWVCIYAFYFFTRVQAYFQVAVVGVAYGVVLWLGPETSAPWPAG